MTDTEERVEAALERAAGEATSLTGEDVAAVLRAGAVDAIQIVARAFLEHVDDPDAVAGAVPAVAEVLEHHEEPRRGLAATFLADLAVDHPGAVAAAADELAAHLDDAPPVRGEAVRALANVSKADAAAVRPAVDEVATALRESGADVARDAAACLANVARAAPGAVAPHLPALVDLISTEYEGIPERSPDSFDPASSEAYHQMRERDWETRREHGAARESAAEALLTVARDRPDALVAERDALADIVRTASVDETLRLTVEAVGAAAQDRPAVGEAAIDALAARLAPEETDEQRPVAGTDREQALRGAAAWALGIVAEDAPAVVADAVVPRLPAVVELLEADDTEVRARAVGLLSYVAESDPVATAQATDALLARLDDESEAVRWGAATALGYAGSERARDRLADAAASDGSEAVREAATAALERLDSASGVEEE
ncbi:MAG: HEAT repeat domain-containing protein [Halobacteriaceae archaeon]